ncbi:hypothetical protein LDJ78_24905, partial [Citrobacter portucalensis]|nr:hypothetical protein [Citrobacter portucalensis]
ATCRQIFSFTTFVSPINPLHLHHSEHKKRQRSSLFSKRRVVSFQIDRQNHGSHGVNRLHFTSRINKAL